MKAGNIKEIVSVYDIVSFDIFNTLLLRHVKNPESVFKLVGEEYFIDSVKRNDFISVRKSSERELKSVAKEAKFDDIYHRISRIFPDDWKALKELEFYMEQKVIYSNVRMCSLFESCKQMEKRIIIVSDMYYETDRLEKLLRDNHISEFHKLYISCEWEKTKASGELWDVIAKEEKSFTYNILHIGDAIKGDFIRPITNGIDAILYNRKMERALYAKGKRFKGI